MVLKNSLVEAILDGWQEHQLKTIAALEPLSAEQLALRSADRLRSIDESARHMIAARARWFHNLLGEGGEAFKRFCAWDRDRGAPRPAAELIHGLQSTWDGLQGAIQRWSPEQWQQAYAGEFRGEPPVITRSWVIWHLIEHDLHHGGEISLTLGMHAIHALQL